MSKVDLADLANLENEVSAVGTLNANNHKVEAAFDNTLSRDGTGPNQMLDELDMNSNRIINLPAAISPTEPIRKQEFDAATFAVLGLSPDDRGLVVFDGAAAHTVSLEGAFGVDIVNPQGILGNPTAVLSNETRASLLLADSAVQSADLGDLAWKDKAEIADINATGTPSNETYLRGDGEWVIPAGAGDMAASVYDPGSISSNAFDGFPVASRTVMKALDTTHFTSVYLKEAGRVGFFVWKTGDYSAKITGDAQEGVYVKADAVASTSGAWVRQFDGPVYAEWYGAKGDYATDNTVAIQAAFNSGFKQVRFSPGRFYLTGTLTIPNWLHIIGEAFQPGIVPSDAAVQIIFNLTSGNAMTCGYTPTVEYIFFSNAAGSFNETTAVLDGTTATCFKLTDNIIANCCSFSTWYKCISTGDASYYIRTRDLEFNRCTYGYKVDGSAPYDVDIISPISRVTYIFFGGNTTQPARNVKIWGGSIEGYSTVANNFIDLSIFGTYMETISQRAGAIAIEPNVNGAGVSLFGCLVYLDYTSRFVNMSGATNMMLTSSGNVFEGTAPSGAIVFYLPSSGSLSLSGDRFGSGHPTNAIYVDSLANAFKLGGVILPALPSGNDQASYNNKAFVPNGGLIMLPRTAAPSSPVNGLTVMCDGATWDPLSKASSRPYWVIWQGDRWYGLSGTS